MLKLKKQVSGFDKNLFFLIIILVFFGILMVFDSSSIMAAESFGDKFYLAKLHSVWAILGVFFMLITSFIDYHFWRKISFWFFLASLISLILVLIPGIGLKLLGGRRWLGIGEFSFQPSEVAKLATIVYLSSFLEKKKSFFHFSLIIAVLTILLILEPDLGTTIILVFSAFIVFFLSGARILEIATISIAGILGALGLIIISPYRLNRLKVFLNPNADPQGASYHLRQVLLALGSGGFWGRGIGQSRQKFLFLPETATDSIFAVIAEEMGFVGSVTFLVIFFNLFLRGLKISQKAPDRFGNLLAGGITSLIFIQSFLNLGSMVSLVPLTGVPLPLISYGRSSLLVTFFSLGILLNISRHSISLKANK